MSPMPFGKRRSRAGAPAPAAASEAGDTSDVLRVLVYSSARDARARVVESLGPRPDPDLGRIEFDEVATAPMVLRRLERRAYDLVIVDGEATPTGGLGLARQMRDEIEPCPPILALVGRREDAWLAEWSRVDDAVAGPWDPFGFAEAALALLRPAR